MTPLERLIWSGKRDPHVWRVRHQNNCMNAHAQRDNAHWRQRSLPDYLHQELALAKAWRLFWRPVLP